jgi:hypothetical protein
MAFRPLSQRAEQSSHLDLPVEGVPPYLAGPLADWVRPVVVRIAGKGRYDDRVMLDRIELSLRMDPPLTRQDSNTATPRASDLLRRMRNEEEFCLNVVDFVLHTPEGWVRGPDLIALLTMGGSAWEVGQADGEYGELRRRVLAPITDALAEIETEAPRVHDHLALAWSKLMGRNPDPSSAYREAIRAVEVAAKPVVEPRNPKATLGTMIRALTDAPEKWDFVLEGASATQVADMSKLIWTAQFDRHGTDDEAVPLVVSQEQADAAFHVALALCRIFSGGLITCR